MRIVLLTLVGLFVAELAGAQTQIGCGDLLGGSIDAPGESEFFTFEGAAGDDAFLTLVQKSSTPPRPPS